MYTAARWALMSAVNTDKPTLTLLVLPAWSDNNNTSYLRWARLYENEVKFLMRIPKEHFKFTKPRAWSGAEDTFAGHPKWDVNFLLVGNKQGYMASVPRGGADAWKRDLLEGVRSTLNAIRSPEDAPITPSDAHGWWRLDLTTAHPAQPDAAFPMTRLERLLPTDEERLTGHLALRDAPNPTHTDGASTAFPAVPPHKYDWTQYAYTDGSSIPDDPDAPPRKGIGAAVYVPGPTTATLSTDHGNTAHIEMGDLFQPHNTINRAELTAIYVALNQGHTRIMTDSLGSICQIWRALKTPHSLLEHRHNNLLREIVELIARSPVRVELLKVRSHTGIVGNEMADEGATQVARSDLHTLPEEWVTQDDTPPSNCRQAHTWAYTHKKTFTGDIPPPMHMEDMREVATLQTDLKRWMLGKYKMGLSNTNTWYYSEWTNPDNQISARYSYQYLTNPGISHQERRTALQFRTGTLYTQKRAKWYGHSTTDTCPLCGERDGVYHAVGTCKDTAPARTARHNEAGRIILGAIIQGRRGNDTVASADVGTADKLGEYIPADVARHVPDSLWNGNKPRNAPTSRPDILLYRPPGHSNKGHITIVEIKYKRDTDKSTRSDTLALGQHHELKMALEHARPDCNVTQTNILLGAGGSIFDCTTATLGTLGVNGHSLHRTCTRLHTHAIKSLTTILAYRRLQTRKTRKRTPPGVT